MSITKEQIYAVADVLNKEGIRPTLAAVRRRLGSGSFTTISEAVNEWKLMQCSSVESHQESLPKILDDHLRRFGAILWTEAINTATQRFSQEHFSMMEQLNEKEIYYNELEKLNVDYINELEGAKACIENLRNEIKATSNKLNLVAEDCLNFQQNLNQEKIENKLLIQHNAELKKELAHSNKMIDQLQANLANLINNFNIDKINDKSLTA